MNRRNLIAYAAMTVLVLMPLKTPIARRFVSGALIEVAEVSERIVRFPYWLIDHTHCFSLDRFDPTCPQCM